VSAANCLGADTSSVARARAWRYDSAMVANQEALGPSVGPIPARVFDAHPATLEKDLDGIIGRLRDRAMEFARLNVATKVELLEDCLRGTRDVAGDWVAAACRAKGIALGAPVAGEEWIAGPALTLRNIRLLARTLREISEHGAPVLREKNFRDLPHGAVGVRVTPYDAFDGALYGGITAESWLQPGIKRADVAGRQASFYKQRDPAGLVSLILGAGNVSSIPPMDILYKMFVDGSVVLLKMNPVNEYLGPFLERAFRPLIERGYLAIVYGGAEVGSYLCYHPNVGDVHITGSDRTHDLIVWGPPGPEREDRKRRNDPLLKKPITSELGNVSPVIIVPGPYSDAELTSMAENTAGMITNNASFNCNAAKMLILPKGWSLRDSFIKKLTDVLATVPPRKAYYPGAAQRYHALTTGHSDVRKIGSAGEHTLPWTLVLGLDGADAGEPNFTTEPFCSILSEVSIGSDGDPAEFLRAATAFANDRVWGTLNATLFVHPKVEASSSVTAALDDSLRDLRFGTVAINAWPAMGYALVTTPWGGHPSATLANVQSGIGWVHNAVMLEGIEKCVIRAPLKPMPKPIYFPSHKTLDHVGRRLVEFEAAPSWLKVPGIAMSALGG
jgi:acyl-CoA reductase-like NAD-dependent aldehyde dehydrogenase